MDHCQAEDARPEAKPILTIPDLCERWRCSPEIVTRAIDAGLPHFTLGKAEPRQRGGRKLYRFRLTDVERHEAGLVVTRPQAREEETQQAPKRGRQSRRRDGLLEQRTYLRPVNGR